MATSAAASIGPFAAFGRIAVAAACEPVGGLDIIGGAIGSGMGPLVKDGDDANESRAICAGGTDAYEGRIRSGDEGDGAPGSTREDESGGGGMSASGEDDGGAGGASRRTPSDGRSKRPGGCREGP